MSEIFRIHQWTVVPERGLLRDGETEHKLEPKVMDVLLCLASHAGSVVSKETLVDEVWSGRAVTDEVITRCISVLRARLGDDPKSPVFIETLHRRGYRLIPEPVQQQAPPTPVGHAALQGHARRRRGLWVASVIVGIGLLGFLYFRFVGVKAVEPVDAVAVLPFQNMSASPEQYLCDGLTEELIYTLSQVPGLKVAARTSSFEFRDGVGDVREIGEQLGVGAIIEGSVRRDGERVRVTAQLIDTRTGYHLWSDVFDDELTDIFGLQERVAAAVRVAIRKGEAGATSARTRPGDFEAYDQFLRGRFALNLRSPDSLRQAVRLFSGAIERDPGYGPAYLQLAYTYLLLPSYTGETDDSMYQRALQTVEAGVAADPSIAAGAEAVRGFVLMKRGEWLDAIRSFERAVRADPPDSNTHQWYSQLLSSVGRIDLSLSQARIAKEIDPLSPVANGRLAIAYLWADDDAAARRYFDIASELKLESTVNLEGYTLLLLRERRFDEVREIVSNVQRQYGRSTSWVDPVVDALAESGSRERAVAAAAEAVAAGELSPRIQIIVWSLLGESERAMALARMLVADPDLFEVQLLHIRELETLRRHPGFPELAEALGFAEYWAAAGCRLQAYRLVCSAASDR